MMSNEGSMRVSPEELREKLRSGSELELQEGYINPGDFRLSKDALKVMLDEVPDNAYAFLCCCYQGPGDNGEECRRTLASSQGDVFSIAAAVVDTFFRNEQMREGLFFAMARRMRLDRIEGEFRKMFPKGDNA